MGGEKLNNRSGVFAAVFFAVLFFAINPYIAYSQEEPQPAGQSAERPNIEDRILLDDPTTVPGPVPDTGGTGIMVMVQMVLVLALAALAIYGVVFFIKRFTKPKQVLDPHLKILASTPLGTDSFAAVLSVGSKAWLVGGGSGGVSLISEIDEQEALEAMLIDEARKEADSQAGRFPDFRTLLNKLTGKSAAGKNSSKSNTTNFHAENLRKQRDRLRGL